MESNKASLSLISYSVIPEAQKSKPITHYTQPEPKRSTALTAAAKQKGQSATAEERKLEPVAKQSDDLD